MNADASKDEMYDAGHSNNNNNNSTSSSSKNAETARRLYQQLKSSMTGAGSASSGYGFGLDGASGVRSVGAKVAHAHVVGSFVRAGCRACRVREESDDA